MNSARAFVRTWNEKAFVPSSEFGWDGYDYRQTRYYFNTAYYNNTAYNNMLSNAQYLKYDQKLYRHVRGVYNPVSRLVETYVSKVYGGSLNMDTLDGGAVPIAQANRRLRDSIRQVWQWSNWATQKSLYVRYGAMLGDVAIKVIDQPDKEKVRLEVVHPGIIKDVKLDEVCNVKAITIEYEVDEEDIPAPTSTLRQKNTYTYTEYIDGDVFRFFKDGEAYDYVNDAPGGTFAEYPNQYGFVPIVLAKHRDMGLQWGASSFSGSLPQINEINDAASLLNDQIRKAVNVVWGIIGADVADINISTPTNTDGTEKRDTAPMLGFPDGSDFKPMIASVDIAAAAANIQNMLMELERNMPELALARVRDGGNLTAPGVKAGWSDAVERIVEARGNYDAALVRAQQMAVSIGGFRGYRNFEGYTLDSYDAGDLDHYIAERPVIEESLTIQERINFWMQSEAPKEKVWRELGATEQEIRAWLVERERQALNITRPQPPQPAQLPAGQQEQQPPIDAEITEDDIDGFFDTFNEVTGG